MSSLENLKKEAKRRLKALKATDPRATLRAIQHTLAREHGFESWAALKQALEQPALTDAGIAALVRENPNAVRPGYRWGDLIVEAAAKAPGRLVEALIHHGAGVNVKDGGPLHAAAFHGNVEAVDVLLKYGGDPMARDEALKRTPADWAEAGGHLALRDRLRDAAQERLQQRRDALSTTDPVALFLYSACWDHHVHGKGDHRMHDHAAQRLLAKDPWIATHDIYTAVVAGELEEVRRILGERPEAARESGGPRRWTPLLYLCYTRFTHAPTLANAEAIATLLLDRGANPNDFYMAGDSQYTPLVGVAGEGEQDSPRQPWAAAIYALLLERGAGPYDIQVLYDTHFSADMLWWLQLTYDYCVAHGRQADWDDPAWRMLDMGPYGPGAYFVLDRAMRKNRLDVMEWALAHGADPDITSSDHPRFKPRWTLYDEARLRGRDEAAELLRRHGAVSATVTLEPKETYLNACMHLDKQTALALLEKHPEFRTMPDAMFLAARSDRPDVLAFLLDLGTPLEATDSHNTRALHHAAGANALKAAAFLIERGADVDVRETHWGGAPIGWASHSDRTEMIDLLSRYTHRIWTLCFRGYVDRVRELLREQPERAREVTQDGVTPLWWLPEDETTALTLVDLLLEAGADPTIKSSDGRTAADWAGRRGMVQVARQLEQASERRERAT